eukprot:TRINITY_DN61993_c0_g1_i1.p1 TRINITY_DN61993_c0_g1~~TRINITY_DN61993_c0_g1_i1.p1  ORF type:complete len:102 (-),score=9.11 TRINITY_DN61993_c0_g1_i1:254-559(-)
MISHGRFSLSFSLSFLVFFFASSVLIFAHFSRGSDCSDCMQQVFNVACPPSSSCIQVADNDLRSACFSAQMCMDWYSSCCGDLYNCYPCYRMACEDIGRCN